MTTISPVYFEKLHRASLELAREAKAKDVPIDQLREAMRNSATLTVKVFFLDLIERDAVFEGYCEAIDRAITEVYGAPEQ